MDSQPSEQATNQSGMDRRQFFGACAAGAMAVYMPAQVPRFVCRNVSGGLVEVACYSPKGGLQVIATVKPESVAVFKSGCSITPDGFLCISFLHFDRSGTVTSLRKAGQ